MRLLRIRQHIFQIQDRYETGQALTAPEAEALNALRAENIRNNVTRSSEWSARLNGASADISDETLAALQQILAEYAEKYEFGHKIVRQTSGTLVSEAHQIARERAKAQARVAGQELEPEELAALVERISQYPEVQAEAQRRLDDNARIAASALEELL